MEYIPIFVIVSYLVLVTIAGSLLARRNKSSSDWAVAGGSMSLLMVAVGVAGTRIGGGGTYGVAGDVIHEGVWNMWWYSISTFLAMVLVGAFFAVPYRRLKLHTVGEIFQVRFRSGRCQALTSLCVQTEYLIVNVIEAYVIGVVLVGVTGMPMPVAVTIAAVVLISYVSLGGLWGTAVTNLIHCGVIIGGLGLVGLLGISHLGGIEAITESINGHLSDAGRDESVWWSFVGGGSGLIIAMIFSTAIHTPAASVYTNYASSAKNERIIFPAFLLAGMIAALMPLLAGVVGLETLARYGLESGLASYKNITMLATEINPWVGGLALAAILAAVISSGGPILLSSATMFVRDWIPSSRTRPGEEQLRMYRIATFVYGVMAAVLAWVWSISDSPISILDILLFGFAMVVPPAIAVGYLIYWKGTTEKGAFWGMVIGYGGGMIWYAAIRWADWVDYTVAADAPLVQRIVHFCIAHNGEGIDPSYITTFIPLFVIPIVSLLTAHDDGEKEDFYARVRGKVEV